MAAARVPGEERALNVTGQPHRLHVPALEVVAARQRAGACPGYLRALLLVGVASLGATVGNPATWTIAAGRSSEVQPLLTDHADQTRARFASSTR